MWLLLRTIVIDRFIDSSAHPFGSFIRFLTTASRCEVDLQAQLQLRPHYGELHCLLPTRVAPYGD